MLNPTGLIRGHYECRSFDQTLPILNDILALEVVGENNSEKTLKHPNTNWRLVVHENGPDAPIKPMRNHYGVRVTNNTEVDRATEYLERKKEEFGIKIIKPRATTTPIRFISTNPAATIGRSSRTSTVETGMGKQQIRTGPVRFQPKGFQAKVMFLKLLPTALWKTRISNPPNASTAKSLVSKS
jgi:hypothetical protein